MVYAGAAPGTHTNYLADLFPTISFLLVDPSDFYAKPTDRIQIRQEFFTDEICDELFKVLFPLSHIFSLYLFILLIICDREAATSSS